MDVSKYYSIVVVISDNGSTKENVLVDYDDDYLKVYNIFNNISEINQNKNIYSDDVVSIILRKITIEYNHIVTEDIMKLTKNSGWKIIENEM